MAYRINIRAVILLAWLVPAALVSAQSNQSRVMGAVIDTSGGALPGVTVTIVGSAVAPVPVVTDESGRYVTPWVPPGTYNLTFTLSGFETRSVAGLRLAAGETQVLDQQLPLAALSETVEVKAPAPKPPPPPKPKAPPRPKIKLEPELLASVCGPRQAPEFSLARATIVSHRDEPGRQLLGPGDAIRVDAGEGKGMARGQHYVVRRRFQTGDRLAARSDQTFGQQTVGLVQIIDTQAASSTALVVYACGEILAGDTLESYVAQPASFTVATGTPQFDQPAKVALGEYDRNIAAAGQLMVIDRGLMQGVQRGQLVTIFRRRDNEPPNVVGEGVIVSVRPDSATFRIDRTVDAVFVGDLVALHR